MADTFTTAVESLQWAQRSLELQDAHRAHKAEPNTVLTPVDARGQSAHHTPVDAAGEWKAAMGYDVRLGDDWPTLATDPLTVLLAASWDELQPAERNGRWHNRVWTGHQYPYFVDDPFNQPRGTPLYPSALITADRTRRIGVVVDLGNVPATPDGTHALVTAAWACWALGTPLNALASTVPIGQARRFRAEAMAYQAHAAAAVEALPSSLSWLDTFAFELEPVPPFAPITVPATIRVAVGAATP